MSRAVDALSVAPVMVLVDGNQTPKWSHPCRTVIGGDGLSLSIAAASIIAKVTRDRMMVAHDRAHPGYGWRSEEHTSELQSLMRISYAVFCLNKKNTPIPHSNQKFHPAHLSSTQDHLHAM